MRWVCAGMPERVATEKLPNHRPRRTGAALGGRGGNELAVPCQILRRGTPARWARRANVAIGSNQGVPR